MFCLMQYKNHTATEIRGEMRLANGYLHHIEMKLNSSVLSAELLFQ